MLTVAYYSLMYRFGTNYLYFQVDYRKLLLFNCSPNIIMTINYLESFII